MFTKKSPWTAYIQESAVDELLSELDSETLSEILRFLSLELDRIVDEQRIYAMKMLVDRIRRTREAEESGNRQKEERRRRTEDELFKQVNNSRSIQGHDIVIQGGRTFLKVGRHASPSPFLPVLPFPSYQIKGIALKSGLGSFSRSCTISY